MTRSQQAAALVLGAVLPSCGETAAPSTAGVPVESPAFFSAALDHLARDARGQIRVDPRPLRPQADLRSIEEEDLDIEAAEIIRLRSDVLSRRGTASANAAEDQRCTFSEGIEPPPGRVLSDSVRRLVTMCDSIPSYTTFVLGAPERIVENGYPPGTWRISVHAMHKSGFAVWDLYLRPTANSGWEVFASERRFGMWS